MVGRGSVRARGHRRRSQSTAGPRCLCKANLFGFYRLFDRHQLLEITAKPVSRLGRSLALPLMINAGLNPGLESSSPSASGAQDHPKNS